MRPDAPLAPTETQPWQAGPADAEATHPQAPPPTTAVLLRQASTGPPTRLVALLEVVICSGFPTQVVALAVVTAVGLVPATDGDRLSLSALTTLLSIDALLLIALILFFLHRHGERPATTFLGTRRPWREAWLGIALTLPVLLLASGLLTGLRLAWPWLQTVQENPLARLLQTPRDAWLFGTVAVLAGGVREELQRAFVLHRFDQRLGGPLLGLVAFSLVFGAGHMLQGLDVALTTMMLGLAWGALFLWRRSVIAPLVCHAAFNALEVFHYRMLP